MSFPFFWELVAIFLISYFSIFNAECFFASVEVEFEVEAVRECDVFTISIRNQSDHFKWLIELRMQLFLCWLNCPFTVKLVLFIDGKDVRKDLMASWWTAMVHDEDSTDLSTFIPLVPVPLSYILLYLILVVFWNALCESLFVEPLVSFYHIFDYCSSVEAYLCCSEISLWPFPICDHIAIVIVFL